jgi:putative ABC transport system permease protein
VSSGEPRWRRYLRFFGPRGVADLDDELRFHVEMRVRDYVAQGMSESDARAATAHRLGDMAHARETCATIATKRDSRMRRAQIIDALTQDVRFAIRTLARQKTWAAVAVITLALGIGATSAMYSVINHLLINPTPYPGGDRVTVVWQLPSEGNASGMSVAMIPMGRLVAAWIKSSRSFEAIEAYKRGEVTLSRLGFDGQAVRTATVLPTFAAFADQRPILGRMFTDEEASGAGNVVLLSEGFWKSRFGGDRDVLGKTIPIGEQPHTVIGVMPARFQLPRTFEDEVDLWLPLDFARADDDGLQVIARLRPGVTRTVAGAELDSIMRRTEPPGSQSQSVHTVVAGPADNLSYRDLLVLLAAAVGLVLLIACANVAHLLLARAATRQREISIRAALGAGTGRLFRQLFTESLILSVAGGVAGLAVGWMSLRLLIATRPRALDALGAVHMDQSTFAITALVAVLTGLAFGVIGAVQAGRHSTAETLKAGAQSTSEGRMRVRGRGLLVVTEMALCTMLLVGASLLIRSMLHLQTVDPRFDAAGLLSFDFQLPETRYKTPESRRKFYVDLAERMKRVPGATAVTVAAAAPMTQTFFVGALQTQSAERHVRLHQRQHRASGILRHDEDADHSGDDVHGHVPGGGASDRQQVDG